MFRPAQNDFTLDDKLDVAKNLCRNLILVRYKKRNTDHQYFRLLSQCFKNLFVEVVQIPDCMVEELKKSKYNEYFSRVKQ